MTEVERGVRVRERWVEEVREVGDTERCGSEVGWVHQSLDDVFLFCFCQRTQCGLMHALISNLW